MTPRRQISAPERLKLWVRAGGRCQFCNRYLLEGDLGYSELTFGEAAHIIGQAPTEKSPRGLDDDLDPAERDNADNLLLLCDDEHSEIDKLGSREAFSVEFLRAMKFAQEDHVRHVTAFAQTRRTAPLRVIGDVRGQAVEVSRQAAAVAVMRGAGRFPKFELSTRNAVEVDLTGFPGEEEASAAYYSQACAAIDRVIDHKVADAIRAGDIDHISVFAFARLPLLIYLGTKLDDTCPVDVYQRHRSTQDWSWPVPGSKVDFAVDLPSPSVEEPEAVVIVNVSGSIQDGELPARVQGLPRFRITVEGTPEADVLRGPQALVEFHDACRRMLGELEASHKHVRRVHLFIAAPLAAAVVLGQVFDPHVHPCLEIYERIGDEYAATLEVPRP